MYTKKLPIKEKTQKMSTNQCQCLTVKGIQCVRQSMPGSLYCYQHRNCTTPVTKKLTVTDEVVSFKEESRIKEESPVEEESPLVKVPGHCLKKTKPKKIDKSFINCPVSIQSNVFKRFEAANPINSGETCSLLNNKKTKYYHHTYDPTVLKNKMLDTNLFPDMDNAFDFTIRHNCCNCIAITLYYSSDILSKLIMYLATIRRSVENVKKNLPDWIVRFYLDSSVYRSLINFEKESIDINNPQKFYYSIAVSYINECLDYLLAADNVEVYMYCCDSILDNKGQVPMSRVRTFRFLAVSDPEVNVRIIREADGIIINQDCHNIKIFSQSNTLFYLPKFSGVGYNHTDIDKGPNERPYSPWLKQYVYCLQPDYFKNKKNLFDLLAGTLGLRLTVKRSYYDQQVSIVQKMINLVQDEEQAQKIYDSNCLQLLDPHLLNIGFDEILLLHMFRDYISVPIEFDPNSKKFHFVNLNINQLILSLISNNTKIFVFNLQSKGSKNEHIENIFLDSTDDVLQQEMVASIDTLKKQGLLKQIDFSQSIKNWITLKNYTSESEYSSFSTPKIPLLIYFLDSLLVESNLATKEIFDLQISNIQWKDAGGNLSDYINIPYGAQSSNEKAIDFVLLPFYDCIYD